MPKSPGRSTEKFRSSRTFAQRDKQENLFVSVTKISYINRISEDKKLNFKNNFLFQVEQAKNLNDQ
jgi:hypothetical protein